jgi:hypothetical protein|tara:strand:+ start:268 stop:483 length:216 start_codon:yes stop_codon:yes gene_type:complete
MSKKYKKPKLSEVEQTEQYMDFLKRALASENFKREIEEDTTGKKQEKYDKYKRKLEREKLRLKFLKMDGKK